MMNRAPGSMNENGSNWRAAARRALDLLARLLRGIITALALGMLLLLTLQVVMRFIVGQALSWSEELALTGFTWAMLLAMALGVRESVHVRMDMLVDAFPEALRRYCDKLVSLLILALGACLAWAGLNYVQDSQGTTSAAVAYPIAYLYAAAPVCGALIVVFALEQLVLGKAPVPDDASEGLAEEAA